MSMSEPLRKEIQYHESRGYVMVSNQNEQAVLEKLVKPTALRITVWVLICIVIPIVLLFLIISPMRIDYFFKRKKYKVRLSECMCSIETTTH